ncbi:small integral membrane protein 27 isoform X1 [Hyla sarda]|uniref:small integral membrane protein 27 isoform X1 n=1 Tax=Hyla sarda TaxID=327740 RepID=UPI0024C22738|nr:small integral membrane protein 27 isoform X1 [Hyla sarda]
MTMEIMAYKIITFSKLKHRHRQSPEMNEMRAVALETIKGKLSDAVHRAPPVRCSAQSPACQMQCTEPRQSDAVHRAPPVRCSAQSPASQMQCTEPRLSSVTCSRFVANISVTANHRKGMGLFWCKAQTFLQTPLKGYLGAGKV